MGKGPAPSCRLFWTGQGVCAGTRPPHGGGAGRALFAALAGFHPVIKYLHVGQCQGADVKSPSSSASARAPGTQPPPPPAHPGPRLLLPRPATSLAAPKHLIYSRLINAEGLKTFLAREPDNLALEKARGSLGKLEFAFFMRDRAATKQGRSLGSPGRGSFFGHTLCPASHAAGPFPAGERWSLSPPPHAAGERPALENEVNLYYTSRVRSPACFLLRLNLDSVSPNH